MTASNPQPGGPMRMAVLGPVRAWSGERELPLGQPRQQAILVRLAVQANRTVTRDQLVDAVWGEDPPATAVNGVHTYVARLRRVVEPDRARGGAPQVLIGHASGYLLRLEPERLDLTVFTQHLARARDMLAAGDQAGSADAIVSALQLWRGVPFAGVPGPFAEVERARLTELRLSALEDLARARLSAGRQVEVAADLSALAREHPLRERLRALEILALYRCGRQADALLAYTEVRRLLADELGIEPGCELQKLYHDILVGAPSLDPRQVVPEPAAPAADGIAHPSRPPRPRSAVTRRRPVRLAAIAAAVALGLTVIVVAGRSRTPAHAPGTRPSTAATVPVANAASGPLVAGDDSRFVADVTIPDGTPVPVGRSFTKVWEIQNTGTVEWRDRYLQRQGILDAPGLCASPARVPLATTAPTQYLRVSVTFVAPALPGSCRVDWKIVDAKGHLAFPNKQGLYVIVSVIEQAPVVPLPPCTASPRPAGSLVCSPTG